MTRLLFALGILLAGVAPAYADRAVGYVKGKKITIKVVDVDGIAVEERTARAFALMAAAAAEDGIELELTSGFRTNERQSELYREYLLEIGPLAAKPGYSNHQSGRALDINCWNWSHCEWLAEHAATYGFRRTVPSEPWHWEYLGVRKRAKPSRAKSVAAQ